MKARARLDSYSWLLGLVPIDRSRDARPRARARVRGGFNFRGIDRANYQTDQPQPGGICVGTNLGTQQAIVYQPLYQLGGRFWRSESADSCDENHGFRSSPTGGGFLYFRARPVPKTAGQGPVETRPVGPDGLTISTWGGLPVGWCVAPPQIEGPQAGASPAGGLDPQGAGELQNSTVTRKCGIRPTLRNWSA